MIMISTTATGTHLVPLMIVVVSKLNDDNFHFDKNLEIPVNNEGVNQSAPGPVTSLKIISRV